MGMLNLLHSSGSLSCPTPCAITTLPVLWLCSLLSLSYLLFPPLFPLLRKKMILNSHKYMMYSEITFLWPITYSPFLTSPVLSLSTLPVEWNDRWHFSALTAKRDNFRCRLLHTNNCSCFELQLFVDELTCPVLCAVVCRPPKHDKDFIQDFLGELLICGDFNIHVCCPVGHLAADFKRLLASFDLTKSVDGPTHHLGHTLDLIISHGLSLSIREISETAISDHHPIILDFPTPPSVSRPFTPACHHRILTSSKAGEFAATFKDSFFFLPWKGWFLLFAQKTFSLLSTPHALGSWTLLPLSPIRFIVSSFSKVSKGVFF